MYFLEFPAFDARCNEDDETGFIVVAVVAVVE